MTTPKPDGAPPADHILLLPSTSQSSSPSVTTRNSFHDSLPPFSPTQTNNNPSAADDSKGKDAASSRAIHHTSSTPSLSLSHRGSASVLAPYASSRSSSTHKTDPYQPRDGDITGVATDLVSPFDDANASSSLNGSTAREPQGSKASQFLHKHIVSPFRLFGLYLSTPIVDRESHAAAFPAWYRHIPPWLFPQYHHDKRRVLRSTVWRPLGRLILVIVVLAVLIAATLVYSFRDNVPESVDYGAVTDFDWTPINPRSYLSPWNATFGDTYDVLLDGHSHTIYSDGRMAPETLLKWHIANGYNAVIVSDHNTIEGGLAAQEIALANYSDKITVIPAMELSCCRLHMNLIGINETIDIAITKWPTDEQLKATIDRTHQLGGLAIINHIPWSNTTEYGYELPRMQNHPSRELLVELGIDGFEIANGGTLDTISLKFIQDNNLLLITGTDVHYPDTNAFSWTILNTNGNRSAENIMAQLRARRTSFLFDPTGTQPLAYPPTTSNYFATAPPTLLGQYFQMFWTDQTGLYSFSPQGGFCHQEYITIHYKLIGYFVGWIFVGFLLFEAARLVIVGLIWGPFQRRRKYMRRRKAATLMREDGSFSEAQHSGQEVEVPAI
ncbi:hypothetical protein BGZ99_003397 [Dissophora globulifera]|uniref:Polymerase/histidinol phosphatase N-terminal domain-containing protein n=1 Tax=Dissophora globulifera TaxID=979702 RepID=A0A9P6RLD7_9FUNG|nr:hypothetical protein BGZ99_003397 [Dissophora globulifera]